MTNRELDYWIAEFVFELPTEWVNSNNGPGQQAFEAYNQPIIAWYTKDMNEAMRVFSKIKHLCPRLTWAGSCGWEVSYEDEDKIVRMIYDKNPAKAICLAVKQVFEERKK